MKRSSGTSGIGGVKPTSGVGGVKPTSRICSWINRWCKKS